MRRRVDTQPRGLAQGYGVKPMNCPGHTFVYRAEKRSYRDLPLRFAEFGTAPSGGAVGRTAWADARARDVAGRRAYLLHAKHRSKTRSTSNLRDGARGL